MARGSSRSRRVGGVNYLASVSDLMSALLFVFILTLAVAIVQAKFASIQAEAASDRAEAASAQALKAAQRLQETQGRLSEVEARLQGTERATGSLLRTLQSDLFQSGIAVDIDPVRGVLRIPESAVTFPVGRSDLDESNLQRVRRIGEVLEKQLVCFQGGLSEAQRAACRRRNRLGHTLDAVFIEGHTDNQMYRGDANGRRNRVLSTRRSNEVYEVMVLGSPLLASLTNDKGEQLFSISGYGSERPLPGHKYSQPTDDPANRRIELRFILTPPKMTHDEKKLIRAVPDPLQSNGAYYGG